MNRNALCATLLGLLASAIQAQTYLGRGMERGLGKLAPDLASLQNTASPDTEIDVIVRFKEGGFARSRSLQARNLKVRNEFSMIRSAVVRIPASELETLAANAEC